MLDSKYARNRTDANALGQDSNRKLLKRELLDIRGTVSRATLYQGFACLGFRVLYYDVYPLFSEPDYEQKH